MSRDPNSLLGALGITALLCAASPAVAQAPTQLAQSNRDDVLDQLVRQMALCAEIQQPARRAECYDRIQRSRDATASAPPPPPSRSVAEPSPSYPTYIAGAGTGEPHVEVNYPHKECYENRINCAYDTVASRPAGGPWTGGTVREVGRTTGGQPPREGLVPLVALHIQGLHTSDQRWLLDASATSAARRPIDAEFACTMTNAGQPVAELSYTARGLQPGETVAVEMAGPTVVAAYVDGATCRVLGPVAVR